MTITYIKLHHAIQSQQEKHQKLGRLAGYDSVEKVGEKSPGSTLSFAKPLRRLPCDPLLVSLSSMADDRDAFV